ncbi:GGDEF domain-containing protein [Idiomarina sp. HP20-50]|uniref:GGDEF domain-containing protein n=1 Tax=Idiomarina sp. HP20-50 TaxID=3070813 RepID=UPI00294B28A0|nr:GGDEF domain-containing protein [Idiomarina sp. HP20-50]MDV6314763.1 GGDEF domain-containing protein [Idiomarina sp. HP20-50]
MLNRAVAKTENKTTENKTQAIISQLTSSTDLQSKSTPLSERLQTSLDLHQVLSLYADYLIQRLPVSALQFISDDQIINLVGDYENRANEYSVMLYADNEYLGQMIYQFKRPPSYVNKVRLEQMHRQLTFPLRNAMQFSKLRQAAIRDHLTGLGNRALLDETLEHLSARLKRDNSQSHIVMLLDMDGFKAVNDRHGHQQGDEVLKQFGRLLQQQLRDTDRVFRYGGDEFVLILENTHSQQAEDVFIRIRDALNNDISLATFNIGVSAGSLAMENFHSPQDIIDEADRRLYVAKVSGKNQHLS